MVVSDGPYLQKIKPSVVMEIYGYLLKMNGFDKTIEWNTN